MRTTLTLDDDVAVQLEKLRREKNIPFREVVNDTLRRGLSERTPTKTRHSITFPTGNLGKLLIPSIDCYGEVLDFMEEQERHDAARR